MKVALKLTHDLIPRNGTSTIYGFEQKCASSGLLRYFWSDSEDPWSWSTKSLYDASCVVNSVGVKTDRLQITRDNYLHCL